MTSKYIIAHKGCTYGIRYSVIRQTTYASADISYSIIAEFIYQSDAERYIAMLIVAEEDE